MSRKDYTPEEEESVLNTSTKWDVLMAVAVATAAMERKKLQQQEENAAAASSSSVMPPPQPSPPIIIQRKRSRGNLSSAAEPSAAPERERRNPIQIRNRDNGRQLQPSPPLPEQFKNKIEEVARGRNTTLPELVIQKQLYRTDVSRAQSRMSIPENQIKNTSFLTDEEKSNLANKESMEVKIIDPALEVMDLKFSRWDLKTTANYVINGNWNEVVKKNGLKERMEVQLWSFRIDHRLYFALVKL